MNFIIKSTKPGKNHLGAYDKYEKLHAKVRMIFFENKQCYGYTRILCGFVTQEYHGFRESDSKDHAREESCRVQ